jgi:hypothetical protein
MSPMPPRGWGGRSRAGAPQTREQGSRRAGFHTLCSDRDPVEVAPRPSPRRADHDRGVAPPLVEAQAAARSSRGDASGSSSG